MKCKVVSVLLSFLFLSCAASLEYSTDYPLTKESFRSRDGMLGGRVPQGWFSINEDTLAPALMAWIVKEDFSATLALKVLQLDSLSALRVEKDGLKLLAHLSFALHNNNPGNVNQAINPKEFKIHDRKFCSYELNDGTSWKRVVVFATRGKYYECETMSMKQPQSKEEIKDIFTAQQTLLSSLTF